MQKNIKLNRVKPHELGLEKEELTKNVIFSRDMGVTDIIPNYT